MSSLNLKIPPPVIAIITVISMWWISELFPTTEEFSFRIVAVFIFVFIGLFFDVAGILSFRKAKTTINPMTPKKSSSLVIVGIYKYTRNPMYVGLSFLLIAWAVFLFNLYSAIILIGFVLYMTKFQIKPEEEALTSIFGEEYILYKKAVRRWL